MKTGKRTKKWLKVRAEWVELNKPDFDGYYLCGICSRPVHESEVEIDHILPKSSRPDLSYCHDNLQPAHPICNYIKGSKHIEPKISKEEYRLRSEIDL